MNTIKILYLKLKTYFAVRDLWKSYRSLKQDVLNGSKQCYKLKEDTALLDIPNDTRIAIIDCCMRCDDLNDRIKQLGNLLSTKDYKGAQYLTGFISRSLEELQNTLWELSKKF